MTDVMPILIKPAKAAEMLSLGESTVYKYALDGTIPCVRIGRSVRFRPADIADFANRMVTHGVNESGKDTNAVTGLDANSDANVYPSLASG